MRNLLIPPEGITEENVDRIRATLDRAGAVIDRHQKNLVAVGRLATAWAGLDTAVDSLFEPLLDCSEAQVACILVENVSARCDMLKRLLHVEPLSPSFTDWVTSLLNRASAELAPLRNRYIHDASVVTHAAVHRTDKRAKIGKLQSRQKRSLIYKTVHEVKSEDIERLSDCISTVTLALKVYDPRLLPAPPRGLRYEFD